MNDPGKPLSNTRRESFVLAWASGDSAAEAYRKAGYGAKDANAKASRLPANGTISARITWLLLQSASDSTLTLREKRGILATIARDPLREARDRIAAVKADNDLGGDWEDAKLVITITRAWD